MKRTLCLSVGILASGIKLTGREARRSFIEREVNLPLVSCVSKIIFLASAMTILLSAKPSLADQLLEGDKFGQRVCPEGCDDSDKDGDSVLDAYDACPETAETKNGYEDGDGCPDEEAASLVAIAQKVYFRTGKSRVSSRAKRTLKKLAKVLKSMDADIGVLELVGRADARGKHSQNMKLSQARAEAVRDYLIKRGKVPANRIRAVGAGPLPGTDKVTMKANRRVDIRGEIERLRGLESGAKIPQFRLASGWHVTRSTDGRHWVIVSPQNLPFVVYSMVRAGNRYALYGRVSTGREVGLIFYYHPYAPIRAELQQWSPKGPIRRPTSVTSGYWYGGVEGAAKLEAPPKIVNVDITVMSKDLLSAALLAGVMPTFQQFGDWIALNVHYAGSIQNGVPKSSLGEDDVRLDTISLCAAERMDKIQWFDFVSCLGRKVDSMPGQYMTCVDEVQLADVSALSRCADSSKGRDLTAEEFGQQREISEQKIPLVYIDGEYYSGGLTPNSIGRAVCRAMGENKSPRCEEIPKPAEFPITLLVDKNCTDDSCDTEGFQLFINKLFEGAKVSVMDYSSDEGKTLYEKLGKQALPLAIFGEGAEKAEAYNTEAFQASLVTAEQLENRVYPIGTSWYPGRDLDCLNPANLENELCLRQEVKPEIEELVAYKELVAYFDFAMLRLGVFGLWGPEVGLGVFEIQLRHFYVSLAEGGLISDWNYPEFDGAFEQWYFTIGSALGVPFHLGKSKTSSLHLGVGGLVLFSAFYRGEKEEIDPLIAHLFPGEVDDEDGFAYQSVAVAPEFWYSLYRRPGWMFRVGVRGIICPWYSGKKEIPSYSATVFVGFSFAKRKER